MNPVDALDRALESGAPADHASPSVRTLVRLAGEVADALAAAQLTHDDHDRIYARSLALLEDAIHQHRRGWHRVLNLERPAPAIVGGAALTLGAAAVGWALLHSRRGASHPVAA